MTHENNQVAEHDTDNDEDQRQAMSNVQESIVIGRTQRNPCKRSWLPTNMIVAYALPVVEEVIPSTYRKANQFRVKDVEGCHDGRDKFSTQERHLGTIRIVQWKEGDRL